MRARGESIWLGSCHTTCRHVHCPGAPGMGMMLSLMSRIKLPGLPWTLSHMSGLWFSGPRQALWKDYLQTERSQPLFSWLPPFLSPTPLLLRGISLSHLHSHPENEATKSNQPCRVPFFCLNGKCKNGPNLLHRHKARNTFLGPTRHTLLAWGLLVKDAVTTEQHFLLWKCHFWPWTRRWFVLTQLKTCLPRVWN